MRYKKSILFFLILIIVAFFYQSNKNHSSLEQVAEKNAQPVRLTIVKNQNNETASKDDIPITIHSKKKVTAYKTKEYETLKLETTSYPIALEYSICPINECRADIETIAFSPYYSIMKTPISHFIDDSSPNLVVVDPRNRNRLGMWNKKILISVKKNALIETQLIDLGLQNIQNALPELYIATYHGEISAIDDTVKTLSAFPEVLKVQLEIKFQQRK